MANTNRFGAAVAVAVLALAVLALVASGPLSQLLAMTHPLAPGSSTDGAGFSYPKRSGRSAERSKR